MDTAIQDRIIKQYSVASVDELITEGLTLARSSASPEHKPITYRDIWNIFGQPSILTQSSPKNPALRDWSSTNESKKTELQAEVNTLPKSGKNNNKLQVSQAEAELNKLLFEKIARLAIKEGDSSEEIDVDQLMQEKLDKLRYLKIQTKEKEPSKSILRPANSRKNLNKPQTAIRLQHKIDNKHQNIGSKTKANRINIKNYYSKQNLISTFNKPNSHFIDVEINIEPGASLHFDKRDNSEKMVGNESAVMSRQQRLKLESWFNSKLSYETQFKCELKEPSEQDKKQQLQGKFTKFVHCQSNKKLQISLNQLNAFKQIVANHKQSDGGEEQKMYEIRPESTLGSQKSLRHLPALVKKPSKTKNLVNVQNPKAYQQLFIQVQKETTPAIVRAGSSKKKNLHIQFSESRVTTTRNSRFNTQHKCTAESKRSFTNRNIRSSFAQPSLPKQLL